MATCLDGSRWLLRCQHQYQTLAKPRDRPSMNSFPSIMSISGTNCEEMIDRSFCIRIELSYSRRQLSLMSDAGLGDRNITLLTNDKLSSENGVDVIHGDVVQRCCLRFMLCMVSTLDNKMLMIPPRSPGCDAMNSFLHNSSAWC